MTRYVLAPVLGSSDTFSPSLRGDERVASINILGPDGHLIFGIRDAIHELKQHVDGVPTAEGFELLLLASLVSLADTRINRMAASQDGWTREIGIYLPVSNPERWETMKPVLEKMLRFLTGDIWVIDFRPWVGELGKAKLHPSLTPARFNAVSLFSGGLDSLIGAIDKLAEGSEDIYFVSHKADSSISKPQGEVFEIATRPFRNQTPGRLALKTSKIGNVFSGIGGENSTRGRSFLFIALAAFAGSALGKEFPIYVPENGLISLNIPLDPTRLASNSTRTTHPYYFHRWNELLAGLGISGTVKNPYWRKTKGEMILGCLRPDILKLAAPTSISCAKPAHGRFEKSKTAHCGYCLPCIIRRAAFLKGAAILEDPPSGYRMPAPAETELHSTNKKGEQYRGFEFAIERIRRDPSKVRSFIYKTGPLFEDLDRIADLEGVYTRGMEEVATFLEGITTVSPRATS